MDACAISASFNQTADSCFLVDGQGTILWLNQAASGFCGRFCEQANPLQLSQVFEPAEVKRIIDTPQYATLQIEKTFQSKVISHSALVINLGSGDPDDERFLVILTSCATKLSGDLHQEELLAAVAHDLKNPLSALFSYADTLLDSPLGSTLSPPQREVIAKIRGTSVRSIELVKNFEILFQMKTAVLSCPKSRNDLNSAVRNVLEYAYRDQSDLQRLTLDLSHGELLVRLERAPLERIISNLLSNALKYSPPHCPITITTRYDHQQAILQVNNKGTPIPHAEQKILFDKYARASAAGRSSGSGLGLFIVKTTAESAGGAVELESDSINGTTFTVSLPCAEEP